MFFDSLIIQTKTYNVSIVPVNTTVINGILE